jgi:hypothetical protein
VRHGFDCSEPQLPPRSRPKRHQPHSILLSTEDDNTRIVPSSSQPEALDKLAPLGPLVSNYSANPTANLDPLLFEPTSPAIIEPSLMSPETSIHSADPWRGPSISPIPRELREPALEISATPVLASFGRAQSSETSNLRTLFRSWYVCPIVFFLWHW